MLFLTHAFCIFLLRRPIYKYSRSLEDSLEILLAARSSAHKLLGLTLIESTTERSRIVYNRQNVDWRRTSFPDRSRAGAGKKRARAHFYGLQCALETDSRSPDLFLATFFCLLPPSARARISGEGITVPLITRQSNKRRRRHNGFMLVAGDVCVIHFSSLS